MLCYSDIDAKIIVTDICFQEVAAVHVACIVIAIYWCTYFHIESTGMLFPPKPTTPHPLHDWAHCHLCIFSLGSAQVQPINNKSIYGVIACLYKQNNTQHAKDKRQWADEMEKRQTSYMRHMFYPSQVWLKPGHMELFILSRHSALRSAYSVLPSGLFVGYNRVCFVFLMYFL